MVIVVNVTLPVCAGFTMVQGLWMKNVQVEGKWGKPLAAKMPLGVAKTFSRPLNKI